MNKKYPATLEKSVIFGLTLLDDQSKRELASIDWVSPNTKYHTDFIGLIGAVLGVADKTNEALLKDVALRHSELLHFLETDGVIAEPNAVIRLVLNGMSQSLRVT